MIIVCRALSGRYITARDGTSAFIGLKDESSSDLRFLRTLLKIVPWDYFFASILVREN
jgi:hypothetical protein